MLRTIKLSELRNTRVTVDIAGAVIPLEGFGGRVTAPLPNGRDHFTIRIDEVEIEDAAPAYADALHKLSEEAERNVRLRETVDRLRNSLHDARAETDRIGAAHAEHVEALKQAIEDERATIKALQAELDKARGELNDRNALWALVQESRRYMEQAARDLQAARRQYQEEIRSPWNESDVDRLHNAVFDAKKLIVSGTARRKFRKDYNLK